jgi:hypothetical protein
VQLAGHAVAAGEANAVLLGGHQPQVLGLRCGDQLGRLAVGIAMVVGEADGADDRRMHRGERGEEFLRAADAGKCEDRFLPPLAHLHRPEVPAQRGTARAGGGADQRLGRCAIADDQQHVGAAKLECQRRAQWTRGQDATVADPHRRIDHDQRQVLGKGGILEAVVHDDEVDAFLHQTPRAGSALVGDDRRASGGEQQRLVAHPVGVVVARIDEQRPDLAATIAGGEQAGLQPAAAGDTGERDCRRCLAGTADDEIADADDRHRRPVERRSRHAPRRRRTPQP